MDETHPARPPEVCLENLLTLQLLPAVGPRKILELLDRAPFLLGGPMDNNFWLYLGKNLKIPLAAAERPRLIRRVRDVLDRAGTGEYTLITLFQPEYPPLLKQIYDPPLALFLKGRAELLRADCLAVVGARRATDYGVAVAQEFSARLAAAGLVIVSGLAMGIDASAHVGALKGHGHTVAVLGSGIDIAYPRQAESLYRRLCGEGCVVSEFFPGTWPAPQNFPIRNRIISGLCWGTLIVEATDRSGSLITARLALEHGRELFAIPGPVHSPFSVGPNYLIKQGAKLAQLWQDVVEDLPAPVRERLTWHTCASVEEIRAGRPLGSENEKVCLTKPGEGVYKLLFFDQKVQLDTLLEQTGLSIGKLSSILLDLQFQGLIQEMPGQYYLKSVR